jgi:oligopeptide transport system substrate-binding protein
MMKKMALLATIPLFLISCSRSDSKSHGQGQSATRSSTFKMSTKGDPSSLDPRRVRDLETITTLRLLYDGLMRHDAEGKLIPGLAEKVEISPDLKSYTFTLREASWSNGQPITAQEVEASWKSILDPNFPAPNDYQLFLIKNGKEAKKGTLPVDQVGVKAIDSKTLLVELEQPTPYFLEMTAFHPFIPVNGDWAKLSPLEQDDPHRFVGSGAFRPKTWAHDNVFVAEKNSHYWNAQEVSIDQIELLVLEPNTALQMFKAGALDWTGAPTNTLPPDSVPALIKLHELSVIPAAGIAFFRLNTDKAPFNHVKIRQAFSYAVDRAAISTHLLQGGQLPATGFVPPEMGLDKLSFFKDHNTALAQSLFDQALKEMGLTRETFPEVAISYAQSERNHQIAQAVQQQWSQTFDLPIKLQTTELKVHYQRLKNQEYQVCIGSWFADFRDPINFLEPFKNKANTTNNTGWENPKYVKLLEDSSLQSDPAKRREILVAAEEILMEEMPIIPLSYYTFNYVKRENVQGVYFSDLGYLDFSHARLADQDLEDNDDN